MGSSGVCQDVCVTLSFLVKVTKKLIMEKLTTDILAEKGFWFLGHTLMTNGTIILNVYGRPIKCGDKEVNTVDELESLLKVVDEPKKRKPVIKD
jgi:hypothetical protein